MKLEIDEKKAKLLYPDAPKLLRQELEDKFGVDFFKEKEFEKIKIFNDACIVCETTEEEFNSKFMNIGLDLDTINYEKSKIIVKAINNGWIPDWNNSNQPKWFPVFKLSSGFGFSSSHFGYDCTHTDCGSRLCFESEEKSNHAAKQFIDIYQKFII